jgi:hypothetical protein
MKLFIFLLLIINCLFINNLLAQYRLQNHIDVGKTQIPGSIYLNNSTYFDYTLKKTTLKGGIRVDILDQTSLNRFVSGIDLLISQKIPLKKMEFSINGQYFMDLFSKMITEHNAALFGRLKSTHFEFIAGLHFRAIKLNEKYQDLFENNNSTIYELWNLIYKIKYSLKSSDSNWNIGLGITNMDYFVINQASNPLIYLDGQYKIKTNLTLFAEYWLLNAGVMNISANYYGSFLRAGVLWNIK